MANSIVYGIDLSSSANKVHLKYRPLNSRFAEQVKVKKYVSSLSSSSSSAAYYMLLCMFSAIFYGEKLDKWIK